MTHSITCALLVMVGCLLARANARAGSVDAEAKRARSTAAKIEAEWPLAGPGPVSDFVDAVGARLGRSAGSTPFAWHFVVFRDRNANAFAVGGGRIYVSDGIIRACKSEAEVAAIIAHEMGHEIAGHFRGKDSKSKKAAKQKGQVRIGSVVQEFDPVKEMEADRESIRILRAAGYSPYAAIDALTRASRRSEDQTMASRRIAALRDVLEGVPRGGRANSKEFEQLKREVTQE